MTTRFSFSAHLGGTPEEVFAAYSSEDYWHRRLSRLGTPKDELQEFEVDGDVVRVQVLQYIPDKDIPAAAKSVVGGSLAVTRPTTYRWTGEEVEGTSASRALSGLGSIDGSGAAVAADDGGSTESVEGVIKVTVPVLGKRFEKMVLAYLDPLFRSEYRFLDAYLRGEA